MENFAGAKTDITLKITIHGAVKFMYWIKYCKATYMALQSGNIMNMQGYILETRNFM